MLNKCILQGRLCKNPELRHTTSGVPVASFSLAVDRDFKDKQTGEKATDFIECIAWRGTAEFVSRYFTKGSMAVLVGSLQLRDWTDRDGNKRRAAEVVAESIYFGSIKKSDAPEVKSGTPANYTGYVVPGGTSAVDSGELDGGDLPF